MNKNAKFLVLSLLFFVSHLARIDHCFDDFKRQTARAVIRHNNQEASGSFYFNKEGEFIRFETNDRYYSEKGTEYQRLKWTVTAENYLEKNGIRFPASFTSSWDTLQGEYVYFKGTI